MALGGQFGQPNGAQVALGGQFEGPNAVQVALGGQLEPANGVQVALGVHFKGLLLHFSVLKALACVRTCTTTEGMFMSTYS